MYSRRDVLHSACVAVGALALGLTGCGGDDTGTNPLANLPAKTTSRTRVFNGLSGVSSNTLDVSGGGYAQKSVAYGTASAYSNATSAQLTGAAASAGGRSVAQGSFSTIMAGQPYTLAVIGDTAQTSGTYAPQIIAIRDQILANVPPDMIALRTFNFAPTATVPTIFVTGSSPTVQNGTEVIFIASNPYGYNGTSIQPNINTNNYVLQAAGVYTLFIRDSNRNLLLQLDNVNLIGSLSYTLFVYGSNAPGSTQPLTATLVHDAP